MTPEAKDKKNAGLGDLSLSLAPSEQEIVASPPFADVVPKMANAQATADDFNVATATLPDMVKCQRKPKMTELLRFITRIGGPRVPNARSDSDFEVSNLAEIPSGCKKLRNQPLA
ncbi:hypothetical protein FRB96_003506 [Tulasnella sp. 330]|nr:hypothetical protein FRB96_003506 [Tulasnella sp. 330]KAG8885511.1 hypothetical protein FRB97_000836 [Tulasnella sp. 331]KAG8890317.1 hypothetical protein FRB98_009385 [Tulasnella sp. 332]